MQSTTFLRSLSFSLVCVLFLQPIGALGWERKYTASTEAAESANANVDYDALDQQIEDFEKERDDETDDFWEIAGIAVGAIVVIGLVTWLVRRGSDTDRTAAERHTNDLHCKLGKDVSVALSMQPGSGEYSQKEQIQLDELQPTLQLSMEF